MIMGKKYLNFSRKNSMVVQYILDSQFFSRQLFEITKHSCFQFSPKNELCEITIRSSNVDFFDMVCITYLYRIQDMPIVGNYNRLWAQKLTVKYSHLLKGVAGRVGNGISFQKNSAE
jgi:hypothetical protein